MADRAREKLIEDLAVECLERLPDEGEAIIAEVCRQHPELLEHVRAILRQLRSVGLAEEANNQS